MECKRGVIGRGEGCWYWLCAFLRSGWTIEDDWVAVCCYGRADSRCGSRTAEQGPSICYVVDEGVVTCFQDRTPSAYLWSPRLKYSSMAWWSFRRQAKPFTRRVSGIEAKEYHGEVLFKAPNDCLSLGLTTCIHRTSPEGLRQFRPKLDRIPLPINRLRTCDGKSGPNPPKEIPFLASFNRPFIQEGRQST